LDIIGRSWIFLSGRLDLRVSQDFLDYFILKTYLGGVSVGILAMMDNLSAQPYMESLNGLQSFMWQSGCPFVTSFIKFNLSWIDVRG
jgi:hypothetical protein